MKKLKNKVVNAIYRSPKLTTILVTLGLLLPPPVPEEGLGDIVKTFTTQVEKLNKLVGRNRGRIAANHQEISRLTSQNSSLDTEATSAAGIARNLENLLNPNASRVG